MSAINNPVVQLARMYQLIEEHTRRMPMSVIELNRQGDISAIRKNAWQVRDLLKTLKDRGHIIKTGAHKDAKYEWDKTSKPFIMRTKNMHKVPSLPVVHKAEKEWTQGVHDIASIRKQVITPAKDIELVVGGTMIVVGRNPSTGRLRIVIEDVS